MPLEFRLEVTLGNGKEVASDTVESISELLQDINPDLRLKR